MIELSKTDPDAELKSLDDSPPEEETLVSKQIRWLRYAVCGFVALVIAALGFVGWYILDFVFQLSAEEAFEGPMAIIAISPIKHHDHSNFCSDRGISSAQSG